VLGGGALIAFDVILLGARGQVDGRCALLLPSRGPEAGTRRPVSDAGAMLFCARRPFLFSMPCAVAASPLRLSTPVLLRLLLSPILTGAMRWPK
jgi:hypothetical protein